MQRLRSLEQFLPALILLGAVVFLGLFLFILPNPVALDDGLRHAVMARAMAEQGILAVPGWSAFLYEGALSTIKADPWFLADVLFIPLLPLGLTGAIKAFSLIGIGSLLLSFELLLCSFGLAPRARALLLFSLLSLNAAFFFRLLLGRPFPLLTALMLVLLWALLQRRWWIAAGILAVSVLFSQLFVFPLFVGCVVIAWMTVTVRPRRVLPCALACAGGTAAGFILHPAPADFLRYFFAVFLAIPLLAGGENGIEMQGGMYGDAVSVFAALGLTVVMFMVLFHGRRLTPRTFVESDLAVLTALVIILGGTFMLWQRAIDLLWPVLLVLIARIFSLFPDVLRESKRIFLPRLPRNLELDTLLCTGIVTFIASLYLLVLGNPSESLSVFSAMRAVPDGSRVLNADWDALPVLLAVQPRARYATGIDPVFTLLKDPDVARLLAQISTVRTDKEMAEVNAGAWLTSLLGHYTGEYLVMLRRNRKELLEDLVQDPRLRLVSMDEAMMVFRITP